VQDAAPATGTFPDTVTVTPWATDEGDTEMVEAAEAAGAKATRAVSATPSPLRPNRPSVEDLRRDPSLLLSRNGQRVPRSPPIYQPRRSGDS